MKKIWFSMLFLNLLPVSIFGQKDYIATDSSLSVGVKLIDGGNIGNSRICQLKKGNKIIDYSPYDIKEFGFKDGRVYISREIQLSDSTGKVFLERLHNGETSLLYYKSKGIKTFFFEKDSSLFLELPKRNKDDLSYNKQLMNLTFDCSSVEDAIKLVSYNKKSLTKLITRYSDCELKPFPHFRYGLIIGYELSKLIPSSDNESISYFDFKYDGGFMVGLFVDNPILVSDFSLHTEFYYSEHGYSYNRFIDNNDIDFVANISSLKLPILVRYTYPSNKFRPFINLGGVVTFNIRNENLLYETTISGNIIEISDIQKTTLIDDYQAGYVVGGGMEYKLNFKNSLFLEIRYNKLYGSNMLNNSLINIITGIIF